MVLAAGTFAALQTLPVDFGYPAFAVILLLNGIGMGLFAAPNRAAVMNSLPPDQRGVGAGISTTFQNSAMVPYIGIFFSLMITAPFADGLAVAFDFAIAACLIAAVASLLSGGRYVHDERGRPPARARRPEPAPAVVAERTAAPPAATDRPPAAPPPSPPDTGSP
ncbi:hypothetical protein [Streptomyces noursei]|uniref:hypothetical protein n=1 Tax=Streptomyces noursei TaxID=1971 RepID=UPI0030B81846